MRWFRHLQRRDSEYIGKRMLNMELPGRRQRGMDVVREDMQRRGKDGRQ